MTKYHINARGFAAPCRATKGKCPYGGESGTENHFDSKEEATKKANAIDAEKYDLLPGVGESLPEEVKKDSKASAAKRKAVRERLDEVEKLDPKEFLDRLERLDESEAGKYHNGLNILTQAERTLYGYSIPEEERKGENGRRLSKLAKFKLGRKHFNDDGAIHNAITGKMKSISNGPSDRLDSLNNLMDAVESTAKKEPAEKTKPVKKTYVKVESDSQYMANKRRKVSKRLDAFRDMDGKELLDRIEKIDDSNTVLAHNAMGIMKGIERNIYAAYVPRDERKTANGRRISSLETFRKGRKHMNDDQAIYNSLKNEMTYAEVGDTKKLDSLNSLMDAIEDK